MRPARLTLYGRAWCHLCEDMAVALEALRGDFLFEVEVVDIDGDSALAAKYDELVPVLVANGRELCHFHFDGAKVREYLSQFR